jgi:DDE_Tnp_1-associated
MPAVALSRVGARVVESGPGGQDLSAGVWQRLEALPDPRSPQGRIYPLACLIAIALCAFTAAGNDRLTAVGQWIRRAGQADLARLRAPWDPTAGRCRVPRSPAVGGQRAVAAIKDAGYLHIPRSPARPRRRCGNPPPPRPRLRPELGQASAHLSAVNASGTVPGALPRTHHPLTVG